MPATFFWVGRVGTVIGGASCGTFIGVLFAEISAHVEDHQRGRAMGWVMSGQSLTLVVGVPLGGWIGALIGWRGWLVWSALAFAASLSLFVTRGADPGTAVHPPCARARAAAPLAAPCWRLLATGIAERICYGFAVVYFATFLQVTFGLSLAAIAIPLAMVALVHVVGTIVGGQLADRCATGCSPFPSSWCCRELSLVFFMWLPALAVTVVLGVLLLLTNALGRPSLMATYAAVPDEVRGTVLGFSGATASVGWVGAAGSAL